MTAPGWGPGWPTGVPPTQLAQVDIDGVRYPGGVRVEIAQLVSLLTAECQRRGYAFGVPGDPAYGCWGYANRPISGTDTPSNHSWGLAVDINAPRNPQTRPLTTDMPDWLPELWKAYGFAWGGDYTNATPDPMHFEYMGTPAQAESDTARAAQDLTGGDTMPIILLIRDTASGRYWVGDFIVRRPLENMHELDAVQLYAKTAGFKAVYLDYGGDPAWLGEVRADE